MKKFLWILNPWAEVLKERRERQALEDRLRIDHLTGLKNCLALAERFLEIGLEKSGKRKIRHDFHSTVLIFVDVDHFGPINKIYGQHAGDDALKQISLAIQSAIRHSDEAYRCGGEEICVIVECDPGENAVHVAENIRRAIASLMIEGLPQITASLGVCVIGDLSPEDALKKADEAMRMSKKNGRNRVTLA